MNDAPRMVDWEFAVRLGTRLAGDGPSVSRQAAAEAVAELRAGANRSTGLVRDFTGLVAPDDTAPVLVVDRAGWVQANTDSFAHILEPIVAKVGERMKEKKAPGALTQAVGSRITGAEIGGLLGFMAGKVLGQFDPFHAPHGRLLLVAPNIVSVEQELDVDPHDFRLWVCLHEETHRVQFTAVPWMRDHLESLIARLAETVESQKLLEDGLERLTNALKSGMRGNLLEMIGTQEQRDLLDQATGMMSLLEGHADVVMDGVGPSVIPTVEDIRAKFTQRRKGVGALDRLLRRLMGLEAKMAQYRDGAVFVRAVTDKVGMAEFNAVFESAENLPSKAEILDPPSWMTRVLG